MASCSAGVTALLPWRLTISFSTDCYYIEQWYRDVRSHWSLLLNIVLIEEINNLQAIF